MSRDFLETIRNPQGRAAFLRSLESRAQRMERAPVKFSLERVKPPKKAPDISVTPAPQSGSEEPPPEMVWTPWDGVSALDESYVGGIVLCHIFANADSLPTTATNGSDLLSVSDVTLTNDGYVSVAGAEVGDFRSYLVHGDLESVSATVEPISLTNMAIRLFVVKNGEIVTSDIETTGEIAGEASDSVVLSLVAEAGDVSLVFSNGGSAVGSVDPSDFSLETSGLGWGYWLREGVGLNFTYEITADTDPSYLSAGGYVIRQVEA